MFRRVRALAIASPMTPMLAHPYFIAGASLLMLYVVLALTLLPRKARDREIGVARR